VTISIKPEDSHNQGRGWARPAGLAAAASGGGSTLPPGPFAPAQPWKQGRADTWALLPCGLAYGAAPGGKTISTGFSTTLLRSARALLASAGLSHALPTGESRGVCFSAAGRAVPGTGLTDSFSWTQVFGRLARFCWGLLTALDTEASALVLDTI